MGRIFIALGIAILLGLVILRPTPYLITNDPLPSPGLPAQGTGALTDDEIEPSRAQGIALVESVEAAARKKARIASLLLQAAIVFGALVSIAAGFQRIVKAQGKSDLALVTVIALCGALSALCTSFGSHQDQLARTSYDCARNARGEMIKILRELEREDDLPVARNLLSSLGSSGSSCIA